MASILDLTPDELLSTTRAVRKRLDLERAVEPEVLRECIDLATQAELYRTGFEAFYGDRDAAIAGMPQEDPQYLETQHRVVDSAAYLTEHLADVPVHVVPCIEGRFENGPVMLHASIWGSLLPAVWNFCLAARARGLGTCWTTLHLMREQEAADLLGIPDNVMQGALIPVAYTKGTDFKPGPRRDLDRIVHTNGW